MLKIWTSQYSYCGKYALDVTVKGQDSIGVFFAPTWNMVNACKARGVPSDQVDMVYLKEYVEMMVRRIKQRSDISYAFLTSDYVVFRCFCKQYSFCHRLILASMFEYFGSEYHGEMPIYLDSPPSMTGVIDNFHDPKYRWLSNFYKEPVSDGVYVYPTVENMYQAHKEEPENREQYTCITPKAAKNAGRRVELSKEWESDKFKVMRYALESKFSNMKWALRLLATGDAEIIEGNNWHDNIWGQCNCPECAHLGGENHLGKMLMDVRNAVKKAVIPIPDIYQDIKYETHKLMRSLI